MSLLFICSAQVKLHWCQPFLSLTSGYEVRGVWRSEIIFPLTGEWDNVRDTSCGNQGDVARLPVCLSIDLPVYLPFYLPACLLAAVCLKVTLFSVHSKDTRRVSDAGHGFSFSFSLFNGLCGRIIRHTLWTLKYLMLEVIQWKHILYVLHALWSNKENLQRYQKKIQNNTKTNKKNGSLLKL